MTKLPPRSKPHWTVTELAAFIGRDRKTIYAAIERGQIKTVQLGRLKLITNAEVERLVGIAPEPAAQ